MSEHGVRDEVEAKIIDNGIIYCYLITFKPNWKSTIKKGSGWLYELLDKFMKKFPCFKFVDGTLEYDTKNVPHIHFVVSCQHDPFRFQTCDRINFSEVVRFQKGLYVDLRLVNIKDLTKVINYINKIDKSSEIKSYYFSNYGFV